MDNRKSLTAKIHIGKSQLGLDDDTYRRLLQTAVGKCSCKEMTVAELLTVLQTLQRKGFRLAPSRFKNQKRAAPAAEKANYLAKITALLTQYQLPPAYADGIAKRSFGVDAVNWLNVWQLKKVIQMLEVYHRRQQKKA